MKETHSGELSPPSSVQQFPNVFRGSPAIAVRALARSGASCVVPRADRLCNNIIYLTVVRPSGTMPAVVGPMAPIAAAHTQEVVPSMSDSKGCCTKKEEKKKEETKKSGCGCGCGSKKQ